MTGRALLMLGVLAAALYYPVIGSGLVSDDFILVGRIGQPVNGVGGHVLRFEYTGGDELLRQIDK